MPGKPQARGPAQHADVALQAPIRRANEHAPDQGSSGLAKGARLCLLPTRGAASAALSCMGPPRSGMSSSRVSQGWHGNATL